MVQPLGVQLQQNAPQVWLKECYRSPSNIVSWCKFLQDPSLPASIMITHDQDISMIHIGFGTQGKFGKVWLHAARLRGAVVSRQGPAIGAKTLAKASAPQPSFSQRTNQNRIRIKLDQNSEIFRMFLEQISMSLTYHFRMPTGFDSRSHHFAGWAEETKPNFCTSAQKLCAKDSSNLS